MTGDNTSQRAQGYEPPKTPEDYARLKQEYDRDTKTLEESSIERINRLRGHGAFLRAVIGRSPEVQRALAVERPIIGVGWWPLPPEKKYASQTSSTR